MNTNANGVRGGESMEQQGSLTRILSLLGGPVRMEIIRHLSLGPRPVGQLAEETGQSIGLVSHNLRLLRESKLVACTPRSRQRIYSLAPNIRVRYGERMLDLSVQVANEGSLTLSIPAPGITASDPEVPAIQVKPGLNDQLGQASAENAGHLARGA